MEKIRYNEIPDSLRPKRLKRDEEVVFALAGVYKNGGVSGGLIGNLRTASVPSKDVIMDENGNTYPIGFIESYGADGTPRFGDIWLSPDSGCLLRLSGKRVQDVKLYEYLKISNFNSSNPNRDPSIEAKVEELTPERRSSDERAERSRKLDAVAVAQGFSDLEVENFFASNAVSLQEFMRKTKVAAIDVDHIVGKRNVLEAFALEYPKKFIQTDLRNDVMEEERVTTVLKLGFKNRVITFDQSSASWFYVGKEKEPLYTLKTKRPGMQYKEFAQHIILTSDADGVLKNLEKELTVSA
jgi:hypothetical protein